MIKAEDEIEAYKVELLNWLRGEIDTCRYAAKLEKEAAAEDSDCEAWDISRLLVGQAIAYEDTIKKIRGLKERQFQLEKKKGTL